MNTYSKNPKNQYLDCDVPDKEVDRSFIAHIQIAAAKATVASNVNVLAATAQTAAIKTVTAAITQPSVPRNLIIKGNASGNAGNVVVTGESYDGKVITETFALNGATAVVGAKAFKSITSIALPAETHAGTDTVSVGTGEKLGLPYKLAHNTVMMSFKDNTLEATAATVAVSATAIESNTIDLNSALDSKIVDVYLMV